MTIQSDTDFKKALSDLSIEQQRKVGRLFIEHVITLSESPTVKRAITAIDESELSAEDIEEGFRAAKAAAVDSYTYCGQEADWMRQAGHFVAAAVATCMMSEEQAAQCGDLAWTTAMNARLARVCEGITRGQGEDNGEANQQYQILETYLSAN